MREGKRDKYVKGIHLKVKYWLFCAFNPFTVLKPIISLAYLGITFEFIITEVTKTKEIAGIKKGAICLLKSSVGCLKHTKDG